MAELFGQRVTLGAERVPLDVGGLTRLQEVGTCFIEGSGVKGSDGSFEFMEFGVGESEIFFS